MSFLDGLRGRARGRGGGGGAHGVARGEPDGALSSARERALARARARADSEAAGRTRDPRRPRRRRSGGGRRRNELGARVLVAIPAIIVTVLLLAAGGLWFALGAAAIGIVALHELYGLMAAVRPVKLAGFLAVIALALVGLYGDPEQLVIVLAATLPLTFVLLLGRRRRGDVSWTIAGTLMGVLWIGLPVAHAVLLRELPHGDGLLLDVLVGTFVGDSVAYAAGRSWGVRPLAPRISPSKTFEGLVAGILGGTLAFWGFAFAYQDWFPGTDAFVIGLCVALVAPIGDLFESLVKRDLEVKDTGRFFGAHGGALDRLDAVLFTVVVGYYASRALL